MSDPASAPGTSRIISSRSSPAMALCAAATKADVLAQVCGATVVIVCELDESSVEKSPPCSCQSRPLSYRLQVRNDSLMGPAAEISCNLMALVPVLNELPASATVSVRVTLVTVASLEIPARLKPK